MFKFAVFACVVLWSSLAEAVKWDFDDGTTQGWAAKTATAWGGSSEFHLFPGEVEDGVWRVNVSPSVARKRDISPNVALISSTIGYDSHLFDRVRVRFRTAHQRPTVGLVRLAWTNEHNLTAPGLDPEKRSKSRFTIHSMDDSAYTTTKWQEVEFTLSGRDEIVWEGLLRDIRLAFFFAQDETAEPQSVDELVGHLEIDWIELTGSEERSQGELAPPPVAYFHFDRPGLFAPPVFYPITPGLGGSGWKGVLIDLDGDGDLDLFADRHAPYEGDPPSGWRPPWGWVMALNDGRGAFEFARLGYIQATNPWGLLANDVDGDGQEEIVIRKGDEIEVWSIGPDLQEEVLTISPRDLEVLADLTEHLFDIPAGDFDRDGQWEWLWHLQHNPFERGMGLVLQGLSASGAIYNEQVLYDEQLFLRSQVVVRDLNADEVDDWVFVGGNRASGLGVFVEWGGRLNPTQETETHRLAGDGVSVLPGDVDGDSDLDLVVLDPALGGVYMLENSGAGPPTAVTTAAGARPAQHRLGDSYPNPFNPAVVIPLDLATDAAQASLTVYDALGRRVRQLWQGSLPAGAHRFTWNGRDEVDRDVAAGVYLYRAEVDGRVETKKMTKLP